jgi:hypothetical protein
LVFVGALALHFWLGAIGASNTLLGRHEFRSVQTAISTYYLLQDGISVNYRTPLMGPPEEMPLEFPLYQAAVAGVVHLTGLELDLAGRLVSWLAFLTALPACYLLLGRLRVPPAHRLLFLALLLLSPLYLFFSRSFLIESTTLSLGLWFLVCFDRFLTRPQTGWLAAATGFGALSGMVKVTSFAIFLIAAFLLLIAALRAPGRPAAWRLWLRAGAAVAGPLLASVFWVAHTAVIRHRNPETQFLDVAFGFWSFGDLSQRLSGAFWLKTYRVWSGPIVSEAGIALIVLYYCWMRGSYRWAVTGCLAAFLSGQLVFSNLYFVHDYYFYANGLFLIAAVGFFLAELLEHPALPRRLKWTFVVAILALQLSAYDRTYLEEQRTNVEPPPVCELLNAISAPEDLIIVLGNDWNGLIPYYARRPALMLIAGRERDPAGVRRSIERLDPAKVAAVVIVGAQWHDAAFIRETMASLHLGSRPLFSNVTDLGIWVPQGRQPALRDEFTPARFPQFQLAPEENTTGLPRTILARAISRDPAFADFSPRPVRATSLNDFSTSPVDSRRMLNAPATTELAFRVPPGATRIKGAYGILDGAFAGREFTDGVEFVISQRRPNGAETVIFRRFLNPRWVISDRGPQSLDVAVPPKSEGELIFRTLPGPANNASFDWAYWGGVQIH